MDTPVRPNDSQTPPLSPPDRLDSWKEIASYLRRGVRTVQRWEKERGLPIHRLNLDRPHSVFAFRSELDAWWRDESVKIELSPPRKTKALWLAAAAALVLLLGSGTWLLRRTSPDEPSPDVRPSVSLALLPLQNLGRTARFNPRPILLLTHPIGPVLLSYRNPYSFCVSRRLETWC